jgi:Raf kinase inhibitor-like YbhB/YbcL family protein
MANIPQNVQEIAQGTVPQGALQVKNDFGKPEYGGPCPPGGTHRYFFKLYALDVGTLEGIDEKNFYEKVKEHAIAEAVLMGRYSRK